MIREVLLRGRRTLLERHRLLRALTYLRGQLRCDVIRDDTAGDLPSVRVSLHDWNHPSATPLSFDRLFENVRREGEFRLVLCCADWLVGSQLALELLNRYQRLLPLTDEVTLPHCWDAVLEAHRKHSTPALYESGLDTWRWVLRLATAPSARLQLAALFHEEAADASDRVVLQAARDLSFFSLDSWTYVKTHGERATQALVRRRLRRMDSAAMCHALTTRQPPAVNDAIERFLLRPEGRQRGLSPAALDLT